MLRLLEISFVFVIFLNKEALSVIPTAPATILLAARSNNEMQIQVRLPLNFNESNVTHFLLKSPCWKIYWGRGSNMNFWRWVPGDPGDMWGTSDATKSTSTTGQCLFNSDAGCAGVANLKVHGIRDPDDEVVGFGTCCGETNYYRGGMNSATYGIYDECESTSCGRPGSEHVSCSYSGPRIFPTTTLQVSPTKTNATLLTYIVSQTMAAAYQYRIYAFACSGQDCGPSIGTTSGPPCPPGSYLNATVCLVCPNGTVSSGNYTNNCSACAAGMYVEENECTACLDGNFLAAGSQACSLWQDCLASQYISTNGTSTSDRACTPCGTGTYSTTANAFSCTAWTACVAGQKIAANGTASTDRTCVACPSEQFSTATNQVSCTNWTACNATAEIESSAGSTTADRVCAPAGSPSPEGASPSPAETSPSPSGESPSPAGTSPSPAADSPSPAASAMTNASTTAVPNKLSTASRYGPEIYLYGVLMVSTWFGM